MKLTGFLPFVVAALAPFSVFAAGSDSTTPPTPTETTTTCAEGTIWDDKTKTCVAPVQDCASTPSSSIAQGRATCERSCKRTPPSD